MICNVKYLSMYVYVRVLDNPFVLSLPVVVQSFFVSYIFLSFLNFFYILFAINKKKKKETIIEDVWANDNNDCSNHLCIGKKIIHSFHHSIILFDGLQLFFAWNAWFHRHTEFYFSFWNHHIIFISSTFTYIFIYVCVHKVFFTLWFVHATYRYIYIFFYFCRYRSSATGWCNLRIIQFRRIYIIHIYFDYV